MSAYLGSKIRVSAVLGYGAFGPHPARKMEVPCALPVWAEGRRGSLSPSP